MSDLITEKSSPDGAVLAQLRLAAGILAKTDTAPQALSAFTFREIFHCERFRHPAVSRQHKAKTGALILLPGGIFARWRGPPRSLPPLSGHEI